MRYRWSPVVALVGVVGCFEKSEDDSTTTATDIYDHGPDGTTSGGDGGGGGDGGSDASGTDGGTGGVDGLRACSAAEGHTTMISSAEAEGDTLYLTLEYGGGCEDHFFELCWPAGALTGSVPELVGLEVLHTGVPDRCEAWAMDSRTFDLSPLQAAWNDMHGGAPADIILQVGDFDIPWSFDTDVSPPE